jgi:hypothetical protein
MSAPYGTRVGGSIVELHSVQVMQHSQSYSGGAAATTATTGAVTAERTQDRKRLQVCRVCVHSTVSGMLFSRVCRRLTDSEQLLTLLQQWHSAARLYYVDACYHYSHMHSS